MIGNPWVDPRIASVRPAAVQSYLLRRGWKRQPFPGPELWVFEGPLDDDGEPIIQVIPSSESLRDFRLRTEELIGAMSILEDRPAVEILNDILKETPPLAPPVAQDGVNAPVGTP